MKKLKSVNSINPRTRPKKVLVSPEGVKPHLRTYHVLLNKIKGKDQPKNKSESPNLDVESKFQSDHPVVKNIVKLVDEDPRMAAKFVLMMNRINSHPALSQIIGPTYTGDPKISREMYNLSKDYKYLDDDDMQRIQSFAKDLAPHIADTLTRMRDNGIGIPPDFGRVFDDFVKLNPHLYHQAVAEGKSSKEVSKNVSDKWGISVRVDNRKLANFSGQDIELDAAKQMTSAIHEFMDTYSKPMSSTQYPTKLRKFYTDKMSMYGQPNSVLALTTHTGKIVFNDEVTPQTYDALERTKWHPPDCCHYAATSRHELGHVMHMQMTDDIRENGGYIDGLEVSMQSLFNEMKKKLTKEAMNGNISEYAKYGYLEKMDDPNANWAEAFAESFTSMRYTPEDKKTKIVKEFESFINMYFEMREKKLLSKTKENTIINLDTNEKMVYYSNLMDKAKSTGLKSLEKEVQSKIEFERAITERKKPITKLKKLRDR